MGSSDTENYDKIIIHISFKNLLTKERPDT